VQLVVVVHVTAALLAVSSLKYAKCDAATVKPVPVTVIESPGIPLTIPVAVLAVFCNDVTTGLSAVVNL
jgi:hypothetical protein